MFSLNNQLEFRKVTVSSLLTCIYLPIIVTVVSYKGLLYTVGNGSSFYILALIFVAELLKCFYLSGSSDGQQRRCKRSPAGDIMRSLVFLLCVNFSFFVGIILFGAPFLDNHEQTMMLSSLLTLLAVFPLVVHCGVEDAMQLMFAVKVYNKDSIVEMLINNAKFAVCGAWLGAVVIPLDWNTPWQVWPIPCYLGALGGYLVSNVLNVLKIALVTTAQKYPMLNSLVNLVNAIRTSTKN